MFLRLLLIISLIFCLPIYAHAEDEEETAATTSEDPNIRYVQLLPEFVVNYGSYQSRLRYFKAAVTVRVENREDADLIKEHMDLIRDKLVILFSSQEEETLLAGDAQLVMRDKTLTEIQQRMQQEFGRDIVTDALFTDFIIQR